MDQANKKSKTATAVNSFAPKQQDVFDFEFQWTERETGRYEYALLSPTDIAFQNAWWKSFSESPTPTGAQAPLGTEPVHNAAGPAEHLRLWIFELLVALVRNKRRLIRCPQAFTTAVETLCPPAYQIWNVQSECALLSPKDIAFQHAWRQSFSELSIHAGVPARPGAQPVQNDAGPAKHLRFPSFRPRVALVSNERRPISGTQAFTTAVETLCPSAFQIWNVFIENAYESGEVSADGMPVGYRLSSVSRSIMIGLTGLDRKTVRLGIKMLNHLHLIERHAKSDPYDHVPEIFRVYDPGVAAEKMREDDGIVSWIQRGRGRVVCVASDC